MKVFYCKCFSEQIFWQYFDIKHVPIKLKIYSSGFIQVSGDCRVVKGARMRIQSLVVREFESPSPHQFLTKNHFYCFHPLFEFKTETICSQPNRSSIDVVDQSIRFKITPKIIAKITIAIPMSKISSRIGDPRFLLNLRLLNI